MQKKSLFITGGTSGIGLSLTMDYLSQGYVVGICGRDRQKIPETIFQQFPHLKFYKADVGVQSEVQSVLREFISAHGLDILVANAGISVGNKSSVPEFKRAYEVIQTNVLGTLYAFEVALEHFLLKSTTEGRGQLVAIASVAGVVGLPGAMAYSGSKSAVIKMCESLSIDLRDQGVSVTCICPGFIDTPLTQKNNHAMPFLMDARKASGLIVKAISEHRALYLFPWQMRTVVTILGLLPRSLYRALMHSKPFNYSKKSLRR